MGMLGTVVVPGGANPLCKGGGIRSRWSADIVGYFRRGRRIYRCDLAVDGGPGALAGDGIGEDAMEIEIEPGGQFLPGLADFLDDGISHGVGESSASGVHMMGMWRSW